MTVITVDISLFICYLLWLAIFGFNCKKQYKLMKLLFRKYEDDIEYIVLNMVLFRDSFLILALYYTWNFHWAYITGSFWIPRQLNHSKENIEKICLYLNIMEIKSNIIISKTKSLTFFLASVVNLNFENLIHAFKNNTNLWKIGEEIVVVQRKKTIKGFLHMCFKETNSNETQNSPIKF